MAKGRRNVKRTKRERNHNNMKKIEGVGGFDSDIWNKIFIVLAVAVVFGLFYLLTLYITNKDSDSNSDDTSSTIETSISYDDIILGKSFSMSDDEYLVIYYDKSDEEISSVYSQLVSDYKSKDDALSIYTVDMSSAFNKGFSTTDESNHNPTNASELLINGPTLIHFSQHSVTNYVEGEENISNYLN